MTNLFDDLDDMLTASRPAAKGVDLNRVLVANGGEAHKALVDCPKCAGKGYVIIGYANARKASCFRCQGKGQISVRSMAATKAKATREANDAAAFETFVRDHRAVVDFLQANEGWSDFFKSLYSQVKDLRPLTERQLASVYSAMAKIAATKEAKAKAKAAARPDVDMSAIRKLFDKALDSKLRSPIFRAGDLEITKDRQEGTATLWVRELDKGPWLGKVVGSKFEAFRAAKPDTLSTLEQVAADPEAAVMAFALKHSRCSCCGIKLTAGVSVVAAVGPICAENWGLEHLRDAAAKAIANGEV